MTPHLTLHIRIQNLLHTLIFNRKVTNFMCLKVVFSVVAHEGGYPYVWRIMPS